MEYRIKKGGRRELAHLEPMLEFFYGGGFFLKSREIAANLKNGLELLVLKDENKRDLGFAMLIPCTASKRGLVISMALYPMPENRGRYADFIELLKERYGERFSELLFFLPKSRELAELGEELKELPLDIKFRSEPFGFYALGEEERDKLSFRAEEELRLFMLMIISATEYRRWFEIRSLIQAGDSYK